MVPNNLAPPALSPLLAADPDPLCEVINGERKEVPSMGVLAGNLASMLSRFLGIFALEHRLGLVVVEVLFALGPNRSQRRPDIAFVSYDRSPASWLPEDDPAAWETVPNLAIEMVSPSNTAMGIEDKLQEYFAAGVQMVWVVYPRHRRIYVYESLTQSRILEEKDDLEGGEVLPGFRLNVGKLFSVLNRPTSESAS